MTVIWHGGDLRPQKANQKNKWGPCQRPRKVLQHYSILIKICILRRLFVEPTKSEDSIRFPLVFSKLNCSLSWGLHERALGPQEIVPAAVDYGKSAHSPGRTSCFRSGKFIADFRDVSKSFCTTLHWIGCKLSGNAEIEHNLWRTTSLEYPSSQAQRLFSCLAGTRLSRVR